MRMRLPGFVALFAQRHIYLAEPLVETADDAILRALIVHAVAHYRLHHYNQRGATGFLQQAAFKAGGSLVPGLSHAHYVGGPVTEQLLGPRPDAHEPHGPRAPADGGPAIRSLSSIHRRSSSSRSLVSSSNRCARASVHAAGSAAISVSSAARSVL